MKQKKRRGSSRYFDYTLLFVTVFMIGFGLVMIYSTSSYSAQQDYGSPTAYFKKQLMAAALGAVVMYVCYRLNYRFWKKVWPVIAVIAIGSVFMLIPFGHTVNGAKRWIRFGGLNLQPAELVKIAAIVATAAMVCKAGKKINRFRQVVLIVALTGILPAFILAKISNNLSSAVIVAVIAILITFVAYPRYRIYVGLTAGASAGGFVLFKVLMSYLSSKSSSDFRLNRIMIWLHPEQYATTTGYQTVQALYAIGSGGLFGKGLGKSLQKLGYIPESQNDMIFSVICEELGLFGATCIILLFLLMLWRMITISQNAPDLFGSLLVVGVFAHIAIQVILNIAVVTNLIPNTGVTLPFISYGGSSLVLLMAEIGIVLNVSSKIKLDR